MKLHRTTGKPDWAAVTPNKRNIWQRTAVTTHSVITPGNLLSLIGLAFVGIGVLELATRHFGWAAFWITLGRVFDIADGMVADITGTKCPLGEAIDATFDKISTIAVLTGITVEHLVPLWATILIALHHVVNIVIAYIGWHRDTKIHPDRSGKLSAVFEWGALSCFMIAAFSSSAWLWPAYILLVPALLLGLFASSTYLRTLFTTLSAAPLADAKTRRT